MANPYKTHWYNRQISHWLQKSPNRADGSIITPECIHLAPEEGHAPSTKPPVRIFLGTEPGQYRATRVFIWSVMQVRDPARAYEIHLMSNLAGIDRNGWKTGFTNYRYAIPHLAGNAGRAIYNDVDQIYLSDPALLFDMEMGGKGILAICEKENSVMLIDCALMGPLWTLGDVKAGHKHAHFKGVMMDKDLLGHMPGPWNSRDSEFPLDQVNCLHYTTLHTQPWKPFPDQLRYNSNPLGQVWHDLEHHADEAGYLIFTREAPSDEAKSQVELHARGSLDAVDNWCIAKLNASISSLISKTASKTLVDYRLGGHRPPRETDEQYHHPAWPSVNVHVHARGHPLLNEFGDVDCDGVISKNLLDHLTPFDVPWVLEEIFANSRQFVYVAVSCCPDETSQGQKTVEPPHWWHQQLALAARRYPDILWGLACEVPSALTKKSWVFFDTTSPSPLD